MTSLLHDAQTIEIKGATYAVEPIPAGEFGTVAARVTKLVNGEVYDVIRTHDDRFECSCPDFEARHRGLPTRGCKHIVGVRAAGFLDVPVPIASKPAVAPVTDLDRKRANYFGLRIPPATVVVEPKQVQEIVPELASAVQTPPAGWAEIEADEPQDIDDDLDPAGEKWSTWTDEDAWTITEDDDEEGPGVDLSGFASKTLTVGDVVEPVSFANPGLYADAPAGMEWEALTPTVGVLRSTAPTRVHYPAPARRRKFVPTPEDDAEALGFELGSQGRHAAHPDGECTTRRALAFSEGWSAGYAVHLAEWRAWLDEAMEDAYAAFEDRVHAAELAEGRACVGHPA